MRWSAPVRLTLAALVWSAIALPRPRAHAQGAADGAGRAPRGLRPQAFTTRGKRAMSAVRGRILYDFAGSACEAMRCNSARSPSWIPAKARS